MSEAAVPSGLGSASAIARVFSDDRLAQRAVRGDERAFAAIFDRYHQRLYRYCLAIVGDAQDAQDALQNTMVKVLGALPGEERRVELKPWLYRIAHNESIELLRRRRETRQLDPELGAVGSGLAEKAAARERLRRLISDLDELPARQRGALVMRELAGLDFAEIGAALGASPAVARQSLYEARLSLRQMDEGREMSCATVTRTLSDGDGRVARRRDLRAHLRICAGCRGFREEIESRERALAALSPLPAVAAAGVLQGLLGGHGAGGGLAGALGGGVVKSLGASTALKGAAAVAVVAAVGVTAADRGGLIHVEPADEGDSRTTRIEQPASAGSPGTQPAGPHSAAINAAAGLVAEAKGASQLGASGAATPAAGKVATSGDAKTGPEAAPDLVPSSSPVAQPKGEQQTQPPDSTPDPPGKEREKQLPAASAHGQQTAASHKAANNGLAGTQGHPAHPSKPSPPGQPSNPSAEKGPPSSPASPAASEAQAHGHAATPAAGEGGPPGHEPGKKKP